MLFDAGLRNLATAKMNSGGHISCLREIHQGGFHPVPDVGRQRTGVSGPAGYLPGHGPATQPLLHQLLPQLLPLRPPVRRQEFGGDVPPDPAGGLQVISCGSEVEWVMY